MPRRRIALLARILAAAGLGALARPQDQDFSKVEIRSEKLADGVFMLQGAGGNIGVSSGPDGVFLVDDDSTACIRSSTCRRAGQSMG